MSSRWLWWTPLIVVTALAGVFAYRAGYVAANLTETDVINYYAARYLTEGPAGAKVTDCSARPGRASGVWLIVTCGHSSLVIRYPVDRYGRLVKGRVGEVPQT